ncbi:serpine1 like protein [Schizosaccharomyces cryophilus OY26]|uniref:Serpine1 like protein n=1 Tax=Schizosaccharomyces cryophilus (strain OY26 / ATCC MYA-4695 / CBS 11777 / NBRC 106824 / NRRL Y48691) TaxID=653667 RepID=S9XG43_SCHCR|nr:serpine1 like protein [Schizosaccharomyces cryophilus OY26]EPY52626.1 serpine1 like protein [Schizosaccharomyces cryophilus OY26]
MSVASKNLFDLLGEETPAANADKKPSHREKKESSSPMPRELVAPTTSSKKRDSNQPTPRERTVAKKADQPRRPRRQPQGNEAFIREGKDARSNNLSHPVDSSSAPTTRRPRRGRENDRRSQTGVVDTTKQVNRGWGDAIQSEQTADVAEDEGNTPSGANTPVPNEEDSVKTLDEFLASRKSTAKPVGRKVETIDNAKPILKGEPEDIFASVKKGGASKKNTAKESKPKKVVLDIEQTFTTRPSRGGGAARGGRGGPRRGNNAPRNQTSAQAQAPPTLSEADFPALA